MESNKKFAAAIIGLIILLMLSIYQNVTLKAELEQVQNLISTMQSNLNQNINNLQYSLSNQVENLLNEQQNVVEDYQASYANIDTDKKTVTTSVQFKLKEAEVGSNIFLQASTLETTETEEYECTAAGNLQYVCEAELSYKHDYTMDIIQKSATGDTKRLNARSYTNHLKSEFLDRVRITVMGAKTTSSLTQFSFSLYSNTFGEPNLQIESVIVKAFYEDQEVYTKDVTADSIVMSEASDKVKTMIASGEIISEEFKELEYNKPSTNEHGEQTGLYVVTVNHSETGAEVLENKFPKYQFKVIVTLKNEDVIEFEFKNNDMFSPQRKYLE